VSYKSKKARFIFTFIIAISLSGVIPLQGHTPSFAEEPGKGADTAPVIAKEEAAASLKAPSDETAKEPAALAPVSGEVKTTPAAAESSSTSPVTTTAAEATPAPAVTAPAADVKTEEPSEEEAPPEEVEETVVIQPGNVTVNFKGADIKTVLAYISEVSGIDIVPAPDVKGPVDLKLTNKPWKVALDIIVRNYGFAYEREGDIIRVVTIDKLKQEELTTQTFNLNYGKAKDIVTSIRDIVSDRGKVMYDERTNVVIVTDIPTNLYKTGEVIGKLDRRTEQVLIEARIIETVLDDSEKLGIDWNVKFTASGAKRPTTFPFEYFKMPFSGKKEGNPYFPQVQTGTASTTTGSGVATTDTPAEFPTSEDGVFGFPFADKDAFTFGTLDFSEFKAVLEFIKARANTDIVSNPRIATLNNNPALINVGQTLNLPKFERNSTTGKLEITGYEPKDLGIILKVTPHINEKDEIVVDLAPQITDLLRYDTLDASTGVVAPVFSARQAQTQVMIRNGDTIFIGGLIKENDVTVKRKLPFLGDMLGDVPYLGLLFTKKDIQKQKTELVFFITVNLLKADADIKDVPKSSKAYAPIYTLTQQEDKAHKKKRIKKKY